MDVRKNEVGITRVWVVSPAAAGLARDQVSRALREWGLPVLLSDAVSIIGELMANAVRVSGRFDAIKVHVGLRAGVVVLGVWDGRNDRPVKRTVELSLETLDLREENFDDNGGWGLSIVETLADRCWIEETPPHGKWVCAALKAGR